LPPALFPLFVGLIAATIAYRRRHVVPLHDGFFKPLPQTT
jgi:hypothetical protein